MIYTVKANWVKGTIGWLIANATGGYRWTTSKDEMNVWHFENSEDAVAFKLKFGI